MAGSPIQGTDSSEEADYDPVGTRLESVEEILQAIRARQQAGQGGEPAPPSPEPETPIYRPTRRPPMALLTVFDDGREEGELLRLRGDRFVIGRTEGNLVIPHDGLLSGRHAEIVRLTEGGQATWYLHDLNSTNGTYVRVSRTLLRHGQEILLGSHRFRFETAELAQPDEAPDKMKQGDSARQAKHSKTPLAALVDLSSSKNVKRHVLSNAECWIGRDNSCSVVLSKDPFVNPRHAVLRQDRKGRWQMENHRSVNGIWLRVNRIALESACHFQLGEQRFLLRIL